jgi:alcohol dehydrogenase class IV
MLDLSIDKLAIQVEKIVKKYDSILVVASKGTIQRNILKKLNLGNLSNVHIWSDFSTMPDATNLDSKFDQVQQLNLSYKSLIVAIGGGSTIDVAKAFATMIPNNKNVTEILLMVQNKVEIKALDILAIPTTAGSGSECTSFATIWDRNNSIKRSLDLPSLKPRYAFFSSTLLETLPASILLHSALDARAHAIESLWSLNANSQSRTYARKSIQISLNKLNGISVNKRDLAELLRSSKYAGQAINLSRTSISHAISYPLTLHLGIPHGLAAAWTLRKIWDQYGSFYDFEYDLAELVEQSTLELERLELTSEIAKYANLEQILELVPRITLNSRFANFVVKLDESDIADVIKECFALKTQRKYS